MSNKVKIFDVGRIKSQIINTFREEVMNTLESHPEIYKPKYHKMMNVKFSYSTILFVEDELFRPNKDKKSFSRQFIINTFNDGALKRDSRPCYATFGGETDDKGKLRLTKLVVKVNLDLFIESALHHIWDFDNYMNIMVRNHARHEAGHLLHYIQNYDGKDYEDVKKQRAGVKKERDTWYAWLKEITDDGKNPITREISAESYRRYFNISVEAMADKFGNVEREKTINYSLDMATMSADIVIKTKRVFGPNKKTNDCSK